MPRMAPKTSTMQSLFAALRRGLLGLLVHVLSLSLAVPPAYLASAVIHTERAEAQSYGAGYARYQKGDFKGAAKALRAALRKKAPRGTRANTLKLLGICYYMLGQKGPASKSFKLALNLVPSL